MGEVGKATRKLEGDTECLPASHISEHLLLPTSRNEFVCWMDLGFALHGAELLPGATGRLIVSSLSVSVHQHRANSYEPTVQLQSVCIPSAWRGLAGFSGCESSFPNGFQHKFICIHQHFCRSLHALAGPSCSPLRVAL